MTPPNFPLLTVAYDITFLFLVADNDKSVDRILVRAGLGEFLATGMDPSIHSDVFAGYKRGVLEIEDRVDDVRNFA